MDDQLLRDTLARILMNQSLIMGVLVVGFEIPGKAGQQIEAFRIETQSVHNRLMAG